MDAVDRNTGKKVKNGGPASRRILFVESGSLAVSWK